ncbi:hypothetical protein DJ010_18410 [Nocardioides silvaticus]|uniref:Uncharacterized protein n=1 Tax=Nocardioides silvaticus TaxID=2201891 RepID=A0A316TCL8_9ACTN|nr:hypothetical protein [Nocardioides silvaticus]PWN01518.1 hypothetical protein DJ010_18410 [Nocardioides silvaticus]
MNIITRTAAVSFLGLASAAGVMIGNAATASAAPTVPSTVTIQTEGTDLFGSVSSSSACEADRKVVVYKQVGARGGGNDINFASDTTDDDGEWNTGNTGTEGKFYAKVKKTNVCKADFSPTITARR